MAYWALYRRTIISSESLGTREVEDSKEDAFAVCELLFFEEMVLPPELFRHIYDEQNEVDILSYDFRQITKGEFDIFLAFECGPEARSRMGDDDDAPRLYILK